MTRRSNVKNAKRHQVQQSRAHARRSDPLVPVRRRKVRARRARPVREARRVSTRLSRGSRVMPTLTSKPTPSGVDTGVMAMNHWSTLAPLTQMSLAFLRPGTVNAPFVEANGTPSRNPTTVIHGEYESVVTAAEAANYWIVFNCVSQGYNTETGVPGITSVTNPGVALTLPMGGGLAWSSVYGASSIFSRYKMLAQRLELTFAAAEATVCGTVFVGSIQNRALQGCSLTSLLDNATKSYDLKTTNKIELTSFISDRSLVHYEPVTTANLADEWVSYAIYSKNAAVNITDGAAVKWSLYIKAHANLLWNPVISTPAMNGIALRSPDSMAPPSPVQQEVANTAQQRAADPEPQKQNVISKIVSALGAGASALSALHPWAGPIGAGLTAIGGLLKDPRNELPRYEDRISNLEFLATVLRRVPEGDESDEAGLADIMDSINRLLNLWRSKQDASELVRLTYDSCKVSQVERRGYTELVFHREDGSVFDHRIQERSTSAGKSDRSFIKR